MRIVTIWFGLKGTSWTLDQCFQSMLFCLDFCAQLQWGLIVRPWEVALGRRAKKFGFTFNSWVGLFRGDSFIIFFSKIISYTFQRGYAAFLIYERFRCPNVRNKAYYISIIWDTYFLLEWQVQPHKLNFNRQTICSTWKDYLAINGTLYSFYLW